MLFQAHTLSNYGTVTKLLFKALMLFSQQCLYCNQEWSVTKCSVKSVPLIPNVISVD